MKHDGVPSSDGAALSHMDVPHICFLCLVTFPGEQQLFGKFHFVAFSEIGRRGACKGAEQGGPVVCGVLFLSATLLKENVEGNADMSRPSRQPRLHSAGSTNPS